MIAALPGGAQPLLTWPSAHLDGILREMLKWSTNITAETIGLASSEQPNLRASAAAMQTWAQKTLGLHLRVYHCDGCGMHHLTSRP